MTQTLTEFKFPAVPNSKEASKLAVPVIDQARALTIADEDGYLASWALIERHDAALKKIGEMFDPFVNALFGLHKMAITLRAQFINPIMASKTALLGQRAKWRREQEEAAQKQRDRDAEILQKQQAKDLQKEAKREEKRGNVETAAVLREQAATLPPPVIPIAPAVPKQAGSVVKPSWKFAIDNEAIVPVEYRTVDESKIRKVVNALGSAANIPGVRVWQETSEFSRSVR